MATTSQSLWDLVNSQSFADHIFTIYLAYFDLVKERVVFRDTRTIKEKYILLA